jgi:penicillin amidase
VTNEVQRASIACAEGLEATKLQRVLQPDWQTQIPEGFDPCSLPEGVLDDYLLAKASVNFDVLAAVARSARPTQPAMKRYRAETLARTRTDALADAIGSNNWVVAPSRTDSGRPILANDPHRSHAVPSLRYIAHLSAPDLDVIGAGEPALPGISIGHNGQIAFGLTIFRIDQEDLYVYERTRLKARRDGVKEKDRTAYRYRGRAEGVRTLEEAIPVKGESPRTVKLSFTRHGPIVFETRDRLYAVRAGWLEPGMAPYFGSVEYMRAGNWRSFLSALNRWGGPSENQVFADAAGNIGYKPAGLFPKRTTWDGLWPVPGDGRYEWEGFFDMDALPEEYNPARGFTGTANAMNLPDDFPIAERRVGFEWSAPWRHERLWEVLSAQPRHSLTDSHDLQRDYHSVLARKVTELLPEAHTYTNHQGLAMLKEWDAVLSPDSAAAALYVVWYYRHLQKALLNYRLPETGLTTMDTLAVLQTLADRGSEAAVLRSLEDAWRETSDQLGPDSSEWRWGDLHQIAFEHPLLSLADDELAAKMRYRPYPRGGTSNTTNNTSFRLEDFNVVSGASFRMVLDVGQWDDAEMTNAPGQSGDPRSPFYDNLLEGWATDSSFPLLYSRSAVEANQALRIVLKPAD